MANTAWPVPVFVVSAEARFADDGVARNVATPVPSPVMPVTGTAEAVHAEHVPVRFVMTPEAGVPRAGVTSVGEVAKTSAPDPVAPVTAAARLALDGVANHVATPDPSPVIPRNRRGRGRDGARPGYPQTSPSANHQRICICGCAYSREWD